MNRKAATPKIVGTLPVAGSDEYKRTNEIGMAIPLLASCGIAGKDITGDALLTQHKIATYVVEQQAHYYFTVKGNQPTLERDIALLFETRRRSPKLTHLCLVRVAHPTRRTLVRNP